MTEHHRLLQAADWLDRQEELSPQERKEFTLWMRDKDNRNAYKRVSGAMQAPEVDFAIEQQQSEPENAANDDFSADTQSKNAFWGLWAVAASVACFVLVFQLTKTPHQPISPEPQVAQSAGFVKNQQLSANVAQPQSEVLADGTLIYLNADSQLEVIPEQNQRSVVLTRGQAYFDVAHNKQAPFIVKVGEAEVKVLGTSFDIEQLPTTTTITVYSGNVQVTQGAQYSLRRGQQLKLDSSGQGVVTDVRTESLPDWRTGWLEANAIPLSQVVAKLQRYSERPIKFESESVADLLIEGRFPLNKPEQAIQLISEAYQLKVDKQPDAVYMRSM